MKVRGNVVGTNMKPEKIAERIGGGGGGGDTSVIDDSIVSAEKTWSSQKIAEEIANIPSGGGGTDGGADSVVAQGTINGWLWRKWSSGFAECWKTVACSTIDYTYTNAMYVMETLPFDIKSNRTIQVTHDNNSLGFGVPSTEIAKFSTAWMPGGSNIIRVFAQQTDAYATGATVRASVYVCGTYV